MTSTQKIWDSRYSPIDIEDRIKYSPWLDRWENVLPGKKALDIGCGLGRDTEFLIRNDFAVTAIDLSTEALKKSSMRNPDAIHLQRDISVGLQLGLEKFSVVVANLSLHYFDEAVTFRIFGEIDDVLEDAGIFAFRVNALCDSNCGSPGNLSGWDLTHVEGITKQFFTEYKVKELLKDRFEVLSLIKMTIERFKAPKVLYECIAKKPSTTNKVGERIASSSASRNPSL